MTQSLRIRCRYFRLISGIVGTIIGVATALPWLRVLWGNLLFSEHPDASKGAILAVIILGLISCGLAGIILIKNQRLNIAALVVIFCIFVFSGMLFLNWFGLRNTTYGLLDRIFHFRFGP
jgi:hypothetical protein